MVKWEYLDVCPDCGHLMGAFVDGVRHEINPCEGDFIPVGGEDVLDKAISDMTDDEFEEYLRRLDEEINMAKDKTKDETPSWKTPVSSSTNAGYKPGGSNTSGGWSGGSTSYSSGSSWNNYHSHFRERFPLDHKDGKAIYVSSNRMYESNYKDAVKKGDLEPVDFGVYFDRAWDTLVRPREKVLISPHIPAGVTIPTDLVQMWEDQDVSVNGIILPWPDFHTISLEKLNALIEWLKQLIDSGKRIEVGCIGAHGRTGTLLACLLLAYNENLKAKDAIQLVRQFHCKDAIESYRQEDLVYEFNGEDPPPPPPPKAATPTSKASAHLGGGTNKAKGDGSKFLNRFADAPWKKLALPWVSERIGRR